MDGWVFLLHLLPKWLPSASAEKLSPIDTRKQVAATILSSPPLSNSLVIPTTKKARSILDWENKWDAIVEEGTLAILQRTSPGKKIPEPTDTPLSTPMPTSSSRFHLVRFLRAQCVLLSSGGRMCSKRVYFRPIHSLSRIRHNSCTLAVRRLRHCWRAKRLRHHARRLLHWIETKT